MESTATEKRFQGIGVSPGIARAVAVVLGRDFKEPETYSISASDVPAEIERLQQSLIETRKQITRLQEQIRETGGHEDAQIFEAHLLVLEDSSVMDQVQQKLEKEKINVDSAVYKVFVHYINALRKTRDPYLSERAVDIQDVARRVLDNLRPHDDSGILAYPSLNLPHIILSHDLTPSDTVGIDGTAAEGFATEVGSPTSHTAIMARSLNIPAIVGLHDICERIHTGEPILIDGYNGLLIVHPSDATIAQYEEMESEKGALRQTLKKLTDEPARTTDGFNIVLSGNIEFANEVSRVMDLGGQGVGLYRTEFYYLNRRTLPDEEELYRDYSHVARNTGDENSVIIRTLDAGGDKLPGATHSDPEPNPFLGWRGIRVCLGRPDIFRTQLRAILRASAEGNVAIMFPFVCNLQELLAAKEQVELAKASLREDGIPYGDNIQIGVMIELPSAALMADEFAREVDFFSIGTNDLVQYTIAVDRVNERVSDLFQPHHPAILRLIQMVVESARKRDIWVGVCGEMAGDILSAPIMLGLGITELSVGASQLLQVKRAIRSLNQGECATLTDELLRMENPADITAACREMAEARYPELL